MKSANLLHIADSERDADMRYAIGVPVSDPFIFLRCNGRSLAVLNDLEVERARVQGQVDRVLPMSRYLRAARSRGNETPSLADAAAALCREAKVRKVTVPFAFPVGVARQLRKLGLRVKVRDGWFLPEREFKTATEVKMISAVLMMAEVGMAEGIHALKRAKIGKDRRLLLQGVPLTCEKLRSIIETAVLQAGGVATNTIVAQGAQACDPHERGHGPLLAHVPLVIDIFPRSARTGYYGDISRTVVRGRASDAMRRQYAAVARGQSLAFDLIRDGVAGAQVHAAVERFFRSEGYRTGRRRGQPVGFFHGTGHGLGLEIHEFPKANRTSDCILRNGHVVTIEPGLYYPETGGVRLEDVVRVTAGAPENLTQFEKVLEI
ncbi:MAG: aminopeptidase P family protein [Verrucomicrobia bacterium]|nr:aminopeptidase P family protein [Verrucomicrobiota bacterium]